MKEEILAQAIEKLKNTKQEIIDKINSYEEEIRNYKESNKELENELSVEVYNEKTEKWINSIKSCETVKVVIGDLDNHIRNQKSLVNKVINYNLNFGDLDRFFDMVLEIDGYDVQNLYGECSNISKSTMVKFPFKASDISDFNKMRGVILVKADYMVQQRMLLGQTNPNKLAVAKEIIQMLKNPKIMSFYDVLLKYFLENIKTADNIAKENAERIQEIRDSEINRRKEEVNNNIKEIFRKIEECKKSLVSIGEAYDLYDKYKETGDKEVLLELTAKLADLVIISQRESKIITYEEKEKEEEISKEENKVSEEIIQEEKKENIIEKKLDNPKYYKEPDTQNIICFLGTEDDNIFSDITDHFDNSNRPYLVSELASIFNVLYANKDYENKTGGNPGYFASNKVKAYREKLGFIYRRFGVSHAQYRIHAVTRDSKLLKDLGYGIGRLTFFGALGVNDDKEKTGAYDRIARRGIMSLSSSIKLQPNFDYIEHISRKYIPVELLSEEDKKRKYYGMFNGNIKGTNIKKAIENFGYMYYDILDSVSQDNVKKWLDNYFEKQSEMTFEIINEYNRKKKNLD